MQKDDEGPKNNDAQAWSHCGPSAAQSPATVAGEFNAVRLRAVAAAFRECVYRGCAAARLKLFDPLRELMDLDLGVTASGVNDTHLRRARAILDRIAEAAGGHDKLAPRGRGRPHNPIKPKPIKQPSKEEEDARRKMAAILADISQRMFELKNDAIRRGQELDARRTRQIYRAARRFAIDAAEKRGDLGDTGLRADQARIDRAREHEIKRLQRQLANAMLGALGPQNGT
jgi:hypothetical protein